MSQESLAPQGHRILPQLIVFVSVKVQGPLTASKKRGQKGLLWLTSAITSLTLSFFLPPWRVSAAVPGLQIHTVLRLVSLG